MVDSCFYEFLFLILGFIQTNHQLNSEFLEDGHVIFRSKATILVGHIERTTESDKLFRQNPVKIAVFYLLVVLVLLHIECVVAVPSKCDSVLQTLETVLHCAFVRTGAHCRVSVGHKLGVVALKSTPCLFS